MTLKTQAKIFDIARMATEFDKENRILHVAYRAIVHPTSPEHLDIVFTAFKKMLDNYTATDRLYLIVNMTNFVIEPELKVAYAGHAREIYDKYIYPHGVARYGYQITRITVRSSHGAYLSEKPNIFNSRDEAEDYIYSLIEKRHSS